MRTYENKADNWDKAIEQSKGRNMTKKRAMEIIANYAKLKNKEAK